MNRCNPICTSGASTFFFSWLRYAPLLSLVVTLLTAIAPVQAQNNTLVAPRPLPTKAQRAVLQVLQPPVILLNGQQERLSPGARIRNENNMLVLSGTLIGKNLLVAFVREPLGLVHEVWILNEAELQRSTPQP